MPLRGRARRLSIEHFEGKKTKKMTTSMIFHSHFFPRSSRPSSFSKSLLKSFPFYPSP